MLGRRPPPLLLHRPSFCHDIKLMLDEVQVNPEHFIWCPCEELDVCFQDSNELDSLLLFHVRANKKIGYLNTTWTPCLTCPSCSSELVGPRKTSRLYNSPSYAPFPHGRHTTTAGFASWDPFPLGEFPLLSLSRVMERLIAEAYTEGEEGCIIKLSDVPCGPKTFKLLAKFCYGVKLELTSSNVMYIRCAAFQTCDNILPHAEELHVIKRCIESATKASTDPKVFGRVPEVVYCGMA
ncbi:hypothetical protein Acr_00g0101040 [Actinidia rufa]|uniref:BTB/POZ domain-containing protein n=1 Tax=Actinidia rufa TaxID=165716 RepID=A0A7J0E1Q7_9ERIC|nr:hypothetical protein Acr_00g0101040 [Actinidia rufa]